MNKALRRMCTGFISAALSLGMCINAGADGVKSVGKYKIWKIRFSENVNIDTIDKKIYVTKESGEKIYLDGAHGESLNQVFVLPPEEGYQGEYTLNIEEGIKSSGGKKLKDGMIIRFKSDEVNEIKEDYAPVTVNLVQYDFKGNIITVSSGYMIDDYILGKIDFMENLSRIEIAFSDGTNERVRNIVNWSSKNGLFTIRYNKRGMQRINSSNSSHIKWIGEKLKIKNWDEIRYALMEVADYTPADIKERLFSGVSLQGVEERASKYYSKQRINEGEMVVDRLFLSRDKEAKKINTYISLGERSSQIFLQGYDYDEEDKQSIKNWIARINNYVKGNYPEYIVEAKVMLTLDSNDIIRYFSLSDVYFDSSTRKYYTKEPVLVHINILSEDYFIGR